MKDVPVQVWLLLLAGLFAYPWLVVTRRYLTASRTPTISDAPSSGQFAVGVALLVLIAVFCVFIFTPQAREFAHSPQFLPIIVWALIAFALWTTVVGFVKGRADPLVRGLYRKYDKSTEPKRYWVSQIWNVTLTGSLIWIALAANWSGK